MSAAQVEPINDAWVVARRGARHSVDPHIPYAFHVEPEHSARGGVEDVATLFLTNAECSFRCLMCDLWKNTLDHPTEPGAIPEQIGYALERLPPATTIKLYNSGNFFDNRAVPPEDDAEIARLVSGFDPVIVESHPKMIGERCRRFADRIEGALEVAMGLETAHPETLARLNKRMTLADFENATRSILDLGGAVRAFILLRPPFMTEEEGVHWAKRSLDFAFDIGVGCCAVIPTRGGNGAMEFLAAAGQFEPPRLESLEEVFDYGLNLHAGRVFVDLWDIERLYLQASDVTNRVARLARMNLSQQIENAAP
jgi:hypothetical protein